MECDLLRSIALYNWKSKKISYITTEVQVCYEYIERVNISLQRDGYVPVNKAVFCQEIS